MNQSCFSGAADLVDDILWAAVCSSGEVVFFTLPVDTAKDKTNVPEGSTTTVVKRFFLTSWLVENTPAVMPIVS